MADITLVNLNMLYMRTVDAVAREVHLPLGALYLTSALETAGWEVDFRDLQTNECADPFDADEIARFLNKPAPVLGLSVMANLLPFAVLAAKRFKADHPDVTVVLGGVGPFAVERQLLERFPWIDIIARGEAERSLPLLLQALNNGAPLDKVPGIFFRGEHGIIETPPAPRIHDLDAIPRPAYYKVNLNDYNGYGMVSSRGCPFACTFCSVAPVWGRKPCFRSPQGIVSEMKDLYEQAGVDLFLFQDEFFVASKERVLAFCHELRRSGLPVLWKSFARIDRTDSETLKTMAASNCVEVRYGVESASQKILDRTRKGFKAEDAIKVITNAVKVMPHVDAFFMWGFPFETMAEFRQSLFQMIALRMTGVRILPSLLCWLPQTDLYHEYRTQLNLEFCPGLLPEYMVTGHEITYALEMKILPQHAAIFEFISQHPDLFPGFFHHDLKNNIWPKLKILQQFGFYPRISSGAPTQPLSTGLAPAAV